MIPDLPEHRMAIVTGASSGIGGAVARALGAAGIGVALVARRRASLEHVAEEIVAAGGQAVIATKLTARTHDSLGWHACIGCAHALIMIMPTEVKQASNNASKRTSTIIGSMCNHAALHGHACTHVCVWLLWPTS